MDLVQTAVVVLAHVLACLMAAYCLTGPYYHSAVH